MDPRIVELFEGVGMAGPPPPCPVTMASSEEEIQKWTEEAETGYSQLFEAMYKDAPAPKVPVERSEETIKGAGGQDMKLYICRPKGVTDRLNCVYHIHGGGMCIMHASEGWYFSYRDHIAATGLVIVSVEFRNWYANTVLPTPINVRLFLRWALTKRTPGAAAGQTRPRLTSKCAVRPPPTFAKL
eukprot:COSAG04_NODE_2195_length_4554_cov_8.892480_2_plen_185_part_00